MTGRLTTPAYTLPGPSFRWIDRERKLWAPADMETRHLFHTVSMIWNHGMPEDAATHDYNRYHFDPEIYTSAYFRTAVMMMLPELAKRDDMLPAWLARLRFMKAYLAKHPNLLPAPTLALPAPEAT